MKEHHREKVEISIINKRVRTYNEKNQRVVDERLTKQYQYDKILRGSQLEELIEDLTKNESASKKF